MIIKTNNYEIAILKCAFLIFCLMFLSLESCTNKSPETSHPNVLNTKIKLSGRTFPEYSRSFNIEYFDNYKLLEVLNPWDTTSIIMRYYLILNDNALNKEFEKPGIIIKVPVKTMACLSATHISIASKLGVLSSIVGISETTYIRNKQIRDKINKEKIADIGTELQINYERLIELDPDILMISPYKDSKFTKLTELGITLGFEASYLENSPLARAEWIKFMSYFFNKETLADSIFNSISEKYLNLTKLVQSSKNHPSVLSGKKYGQIWYVPGGNSYMGSFYNDAGGDYLWSDNSETGSLALDFETVYNKAHAADFWCFKTGLDSEYRLTDLLGEYANYSDFDAFKNKKIIVCNTVTTDYYETGFLEPDAALADMISIFYPDILPGHKAKYYKLIE